jgi:two-component system probable response regulator PhcQ
MSRHAILIVDDEIKVLNAIQRTLRKEPYTVLTAEGAEEGLKILDARDINLVVSDYNMPMINGLEFLQNVRTLHPHILTIMLTGQAELQIAVQAINEAGVYKFIQKPWNNDDLRITLLRALESIDLATERDRLVQKVKSRDAILQDLEKKFPGITKVERDADGYMLVR